MARQYSADPVVDNVGNEFDNAVNESIALVNYQHISVSDTEAIRLAVQRIVRIHPALQAVFDKLFFQVLAMLRAELANGWFAGKDAAEAEIEAALEKEKEEAGVSTVPDIKIVKHEEEVVTSISTPPFDASISFALGKTPSDKSNIRAAQYLLENPNDYNLGNMYARLNAQAVTFFEQEFIRAVKEGINPLEFAERIRKKLGLTKASAQTLARTAIMEAHRTAMHKMYSDNSDIIKEWEWNAKLDKRTCPVCYAMDGTHHPLKESLKSHPNCRCVPKPITFDAVELGWLDPLDNKDRGDRRDEIRDRQRTTDERFASMSDSDKRAILGNGRFELYSYGTHDLSDFVTKTSYFNYGEGLAVKSLKSLGYDPKTKSSSSGLFGQTWQDVLRTVDTKKQHGLIGLKRHAKAKTAIAKAMSNGYSAPPKSPGIGT